MSIRKIAVVAIQLILLAAVSFAQGVATGDLHVTVRDPKGGLVTSGAVTARDESKALERSTDDNTDGQYRILLLPPGTYTVTVTAPGFANVKVTGDRSRCWDYRGNPGDAFGCWNRGSDQCELRGGVGGNAAHVHDRYD